MRTSCDQFSTDYKGRSDKPAIYQSGRTFLKSCQAFSQKKDPYTISDTEILLGHLNLMTLAYDHPLFNRKHALNDHSNPSYSHKQIADHKTG